MPNYATPGVYIEEVSTGSKPINMVGTQTAAFIGIAPDKQKNLNKAVACNNWPQFVRIYVGDNGGTDTNLSMAVYAFFQ